MANVDAFWYPPSPAYVTIVRTEHLFIHNKILKAWTLFACILYPIQCVAPQSYSCNCAWKLSKLTRSKSLWKLNPANQLTLHVYNGLSIPNFHSHRSRFSFYGCWGKRPESFERVRDDSINKTVFLCFLGTHEEIPVCVLHNFVQCLPSVVCKVSIQICFVMQNLVSLSTNQIHIFECRDKNLDVNIEISPDTAGASPTCINKPDKVNWWSQLSLTE